jgi:tetratricopeptide (TPR) repeat protein
VSLRSSVLVLLVVLVLRADTTLADRIRSAQTSGDYKEAAHLYLELIASGTDSPEIRSNCGIMLHLSGQNEQALDQLLIALRQNPKLASANLFAGLSELDLGRTRNALPYLLKAQQADPDHPAPLLALGKANLALHHYSDAADFYSRAAVMDASLAEAWFGRGVASRSLADQILNQSARQGTLKQSGKSAQVQQLLRTAVESLTRAAELSPNSANTHLLMAESLADQNKAAESIAEYNAALRLDPGMDAARSGLATQSWKNRQFDEAKPLLQEVLRKNPKDPEANAMMADILERSEDTEAALRFAQTALAGNPNLIQTRIVLARLYLKKQSPQQAIAEIRKVISADPDGSYHFLLYRACRQAGDESGAQTALAEFQKLRKPGVSAQ